MLTLKAILAGGIMVSTLAISYFFFRFWRKTRDRLFAWFALAFLLLGLERMSIAASAASDHSHVYLIRLAAFLLIILAVLDKNRKRDGR